jgi:hypothetical protein
MLRTFGNINNRGFLQIFRVLCTFYDPLKDVGNGWDFKSASCFCLYYKTTTGYNKNAFTRLRKDVFTGLD